MNNDASTTPYRPESLLRLSEVRTIVPLSRSAIYRLTASGSFPAPVKIGGNASAWRWSDIQKWLDSRQPSAGPQRAA